MGAVDCRVWVLWIGPIPLHLRDAPSDFEVWMLHQCLGLFVMFTQPSAVFMVGNYCHWVMPLPWVCNSIGGCYMSNMNVRIQDFPAGDSILLWEKKTNKKKPHQWCGDRELETSTAKRSNLTVRPWELFGKQLHSERPSGSLYLEMCV